MSDLDFNGRVVVITGAGRGLGRAYAELLAALGAKVLVNDIGVPMSGEGECEDVAGDVVTLLNDAGGEAVANRDTVATANGGRRIIEQALDTWGRVDALIHNAGNTRRAPLAEMTEDMFRSIIDVHLVGGFNVLRPAFAAMCKVGFGRIVLTTSIGGLYGNYQVAAYSAAKAGLIGLSHTAALEGAPHNVKSNCIAPSAVTRMSEGVDTSQFPPLGAEFVAPAVGWLCHESCTISGEIIVALGGRIAAAYLSETRGIVQANWTIANVRSRIEEIRAQSEQFVFPVVPAELGGRHAFMKHLGASFEMVQTAWKQGTFEASAQSVD